MSKPNRTLVGTITREATRTFPLEVNEENFQLWREHWVKTGEKIHQEFLSQGLIKTAEAIRGHLDMERKLK